jgi:uncharacterized phage protein gp47/JayE
VGITRIQAVKATGSVVFTLTPGPSTAQTIPAGTVVSTSSAPATYFITTQAATIPVPGTQGQPSSSGATLVAANLGGAAGNVNAGQILIVNYQIPSAVLSVSNSAATTGGADAEADTALRARAIAASQVKYSAAALAAAVIAVSGVWDCWINDPAAPPGTDANPGGSSTAGSTYTAYWCDSSGNQPGAGSPNTGTALAVQNALAAVQDAGLVATLAAFTVVQITAVTVGYRVPASVSTSTIVPAIQNAVVAFIQTLVHNQVPDQSNMYKYVNNAVGGVLTKFTLVSTTPAIGSETHSVIYRCTGTPSSVVTCNAI